MSLADYWARVEGRYYRSGARCLFKRPVAVQCGVPLISFTFDDFPRSALLTGGTILRRFGLAGTYYASLGLMGGEAPTGQMFVAEDLKALVQQGHELGCHTFGHCHSAETKTRVFEHSIIQNRLALHQMLPAVSFRTFSYPISPPRLQTKRRMAKHFAGCRGGGQTSNVRTADLGYLAAFFLEQSRDDIGAVKNLIQQNRKDQGWLIFATHDISESPTPFGCTPDFFEEVVQASVQSGAKILPMAEVLEVLNASSTS